MRWTLLLLLLTVRRQSRAGPRQERVPIFRLAPHPSWGSGGGNATASPCEGLAEGPAAWTLANRSLEHLPRCLPRALRSLDGSHNLLRALSAAELGHLPALQELTLRHNRIAALRWGPGGPAGLRALDLSYNRLAAPPPCAGPVLRSLRVLELAGNPLRALPPRAFVCFPALQRLNLSGTELGRGAQGGIAPGAFAGEAGEPLATLQVLDLSGTHLQQSERGSCGAGSGGGSLQKGSEIPPSPLLQGEAGCRPRAGLSLVPWRWEPLNLHFTPEGTKAPKVA